MTLHLLATETEPWVQTWKHINFHDWINTALSSDHIFAEVVGEIVIGVVLIGVLGFGFRLIRRFIRKHDEHHTNEFEDRIAALEARINSKPDVSFRDFANEMGVA
jgi:predicted permease